MDNVEVYENNSEENRNERDHQLRMDVSSLDFIYERFSKYM